MVNKDNIDALIKESMIARTAVRTLLLRDIKTEFSRAETAKNAKELDEIAVLKSMKKKREDSYSQYVRMGRTDLGDIEFEEIQILSEFLPEEMSEDKLREAIEEIVNDLKSMGCADMKSVMLNVKKLPNVDMKLASNTVKSLIK